MKPKQNNLLTPTYQTILISDLTQVNECFFNADYQGSYQALRILIADLLKKEREKIKTEWDTFQKNLQAITVNGGSITRNTINKQQAIDNYLYQNIPEIKAKLTLILEEGNLLNIDTAAKPKFDSSQARRYTPKQE